MYLCIYTHTYLEYLSKSSIWPFSQWHHLKPRGIISYNTLKISSSIFASPISDLFVYLIFFPKCVTEGLVLFSQPIPPFVSSCIWLISPQVHSLIFLSDMPFKEQWTLSSKCYATSFNYSACFSPRHVFPGDMHAIFWVLEHTGHPCLHLHHHCRFQVVSVISSPSWLPSPGSRLHFPVQSLLVAWGVLDTLTVAIYERKVIPC